MQGRHDGGFRVTRAAPRVNTGLWPFGARFALLIFGLFLYGLAIRLMLNAGVGLSPWDTFHQGLARRAGFTVGEASILAGLVVLAFGWLWLRVRPGLGSVLNMLLIGVFIDLLAFLAPHPAFLVGRWAQFALGVALMGLATGTYIASGMGAGPRDGLVIGLGARYGWPVGRVRTGLELLVLLAGVLLGGQVGWGTLAFALGIGPAMSFGLRLYGLERKK